MGGRGGGGGDNNDKKEGDIGSRGSVVACEFYNTGGVISLGDKDIVQTLTEDILPRKAIYLEE